MALYILGRVAFAEKDAVRAARLVRDAADAAEAEGKAWFRGVTLFGASEELLALGELEAAKHSFPRGSSCSAPSVTSSISRLRSQPARPLRRGCGDPVRAGTLWGAIEAEAERTPRETTTESLAQYEPYVEPVRDDAFEEARKQGRTLSLEEAIAYALGERG